MNNLIEVINLRKYFRSGDSTLKVLDDLNLSVPRGQVLAVTGESGVGKSTLLSLIGGLDSATAGIVRIQGQDITQLPEEKLARFRAENIGFVFQNHFLLSEFTAYENILLPYLVKKARLTKEINSYILELLDLVNLKDRKHHKPGELSGGECQRVALLRALVNKPQIVIADEPTGNLDEKNTRLIFELVKNLNRRYRVTFIIATHNLLVKRFSDEVQVIRQGKIFKRS